MASTSPPPPPAPASHLHPVADADDRSPFGAKTPDEFYAHHGVEHGSDYFLNPRGLRIFTQWWLPLPPVQPAGVVALVHGFTGESSWFVQLTAVLFAKSGYAACALDHQGHGFSEGLLYHIPDLNPVVDDCAAFFSDFRSRFYPSLPAFLYAESLGGAIALLLHLRSLDGDASAGDWAGLVLNGAMCAVSDKFKPPWPMEYLLGFAAAVAPTWEVVPTRGSIPEVSFKVEWKRRLAVGSPRRKVRRPRAATAQELLRVCREVQGRFGDVVAPMLIVHGEEDKICDPDGVAELHRLAGSKDKTLKIYPRMWHQLIGEEEDDVDIVFGDILEWLRART